MNGRNDVVIKIGADLSAAKQELAGAEKEVQGWGQRIKGLMGPALVAAGAAAAAGLARFFKSAIDASVEMENSQRKLEATAKLTGIALQELEAIASKGRNAFGLNAELANDFSVELAKLAAKAGDVSKATPGMAAFLDLGAARGLTAADTLKAVQQSILGIDEGTDKLFGSNPSVLYDRFAQSIGTTAGKLTDAQKAQALLSAALEDGGKVQGTYQQSLGTFGGVVATVSNAWQSLKIAVGDALLASGDFASAGQGLAGVLAGLAGWVERNEGGIRAVVAAFGDWWHAIVDVAKAVASAIAPAIQSFAGEGSALVKLGGVLQLVSAAFRGLAAAGQFAAGVIYQALGGLIEGAGRFLSLLGIDVVQGTGEALRRVGEAAVEQSRLLGQKAADATREALEQIRTGRVAGQQQIEQDHADHAQRLVRTTQQRAAAELQEEEKLATARAKLAAETEKRLRDLAKAFREQLSRQTEDAARIVERLGEALGLALGPTAKQMIAATNAEIVGMVRVAEQLHREGRITAEQWDAIQAGARQHQTQLRELLPSVDSLQASVEAYRQHLAAAAEHTKANRDRMRDLVGNVADVARGAVDFGQAFGIASSEAASVLNSVINIGTSFQKVLGGDVTGVIGVLGGLANLIGNWGSSAAEQERKRVLAENTKALQEMTDVFALQTTGGQLDAVNKAIQDALKFRSAGAGAVSQEFGLALTRRGISRADADKILQELGFGAGLQAGGQAFVDTLIAAGQKIGSIQIGSQQQSITEQIDFLRETADVFGKSQDDLLLEIARLLQSDIAFGPGGPQSTAIGQALAPGLGTAAGRESVVANLLDLLEKLGPGGEGIEPFLLGGLSPQEFKEMIQFLIPLIQGSALEFPAPPGFLPPSPTFTGLPKGSAGEFATTAFVPTVPIETEFATTAFVPTGTFDAGALVGTTRAALPTVSAGAVGGVSVAGDLIVNNEFHGIEDPRAFSREFVEGLTDVVALELGRRNALSRAAKGMSR